MVNKDFSEQKCYRLIPSKFPPIDLYEDVASVDELEAVYAIEKLTNPRIEQQAGNLDLVPKEDWLTGPGSSFAMAAFTHLNPDGGRFTTGDFGAYYCAEHLNTAIKETVYHQERILSYTNEPSQTIQMRCIKATFSACLVDLTEHESLESSLYHPTCYKESKAFALSCKQNNEDGIAYFSVRHTNNLCFALYKPKLITSICQAEHFGYMWNGRTINNVIKLTMI